MLSTTSSAIDPPRVSGSTAPRSVQPVAEENRSSATASPLASQSHSRRSLAGITSSSEAQRERVAEVVAEVEAGRADSASEWYFSRLLCASGSPLTTIAVKRRDQILSRQPQELDAAAQGELREGDGAVILLPFLFNAS